VRKWAHHPEMQRQSDPASHRALARKLNDAWWKARDEAVLQRILAEHRQGMTCTERWADSLLMEPLLRLAIWIGDWVEK
jgi:hypothetical protein